MCWTWYPSFSSVSISIPDSFLIPDLQSTFSHCCKLQLFPRDPDTRRLFCMCSLADSLDRSSLEMSEDAFAENLGTQDSQEAPDTMDQKAEGFPEEVANVDSHQDQAAAKHPTDEELPNPEPPLKKTKTDSESPQVDAELSLVLESDAGMISPGEVSSPSGMPPPPPPKSRGKGRKGKGGKMHDKNQLASDAPSSQAMVLAAELEDEMAPSVTSTGSRTKAQGKGQKKASKTNSRYCKGDGLYYSPEDMAPKSAFCFRCKYCMDVLTKLAKSERRPEWISEIKSNEKVLQNIIRKYKEQTGDGIARKRNFKGKLMSTLQETAAKSRVLYNTEMEMMTEDAWQPSGQSGSARWSLRILPKISFSTTSVDSESPLPPKTRSTSSLILGLMRYLL